MLNYSYNRSSCVYMLPVLLKYRKSNHVKFATVVVIFNSTASIYKSGAFVRKPEPRSQKLQLRKEHLSKITFYMSKRSMQVGPANSTLVAKVRVRTVKLSLLISRAKPCKNSSLCINVSIFYARRPYTYMYGCLYLCV